MSVAEPQPVWVIAAAVNSELRGLRDRLGAGQGRRLRQGNLWEARWKDRDVWLLRTGIGPAKVARAMAEVTAARSCRGVLSVGYAGALREHYRVGDLLIPTEVRSLPPLPKASYRPDEGLFQRLCDLAARSGQPFHVERMLTVNRVITSSEEKRRLGRLHDAGSVEMESSVVAGVAARLSIPFLAVRVVSDTASFSLPDLSFLHHARRQQLTAMVRYVVRRPLETLRFLALRRYGRIASRRLSGFLGGGGIDVLTT